MSVGLSASHNFLTRAIRVTQAETREQVAALLEEILRPSAAPSEREYFVGLLDTGEPRPFLTSSGDDSFLVDEKFTVTGDAVS